jgi:AcrR family transcriptional regulator
MNDPVNTERRWPRRTAKAKATRAAVIAAAATLFVEQGYLGTTIEAVADLAGVSRATVFNSVGGKLQLLRAAYDVATVGDDEPVALPQRPEARAVIDEPDPVRACELYATMVTGVNQRLVGTYETFRAAAGADPQARGEWEQIQHERLGGARGFLRILSAKGPLQTGLDHDRAGDVVWTLIDASLYQRLVIERAWTPEQFRRWLARRLKQELLPPDTDTPTTAAASVTSRSRKRVPISKPGLPSTAR